MKLIYLNPAYVSSIIERWESVTGKKAKKSDGSEIDVIKR